MKKPKKKYWKAKRDLNKKLRKMRGDVKNQNLLTKMLRGISRFSKSDLVKLESYKNNSSIGNFVRKIPNLMKDYVIFGPGRFILFLFGGAALADKLIEKTTAKLFGKGYDEYKDKEMLEAKEKQEEFTMNDLRARMVELYNAKQNPATDEKAEEAKMINTDYVNKTVPESMQKLAQKSDEVVDSESYMNLKENEAVAQEKSITKSDIEEDVSKSTSPINENIQPKSDVTQMIMPVIKKGENKTNHNAENKVPVEKKYDNYTYIPSSENVLKNADNSPQVNKYIPAQTAIKINKVFDNSGLEAAIKRANRAEQRAINTLAGNFGSAS